MKKNKTPSRSSGSVNIVSKTVSRFFINNLFIFAALLMIYAVIFLFVSRYPGIAVIVEAIYFNLLSPILSTVFNEDFVAFIYEHSIFLYLIWCMCFFVIHCLIQSVITLINFNKTYQSLDSFVDPDNNIQSFAKPYSDIEIKLKDIKLEVLESKSRAAEAESKKNDLVMYLAHDLKTPLTSIIGYLTLLDESPELTVEQRAKFTGIALDKSYRLEQLISEFFEITRFNIHTVTLQRNKVNLGLMINQIADEFYPMLSEKGLEIRVDIPYRILIFADSDKLARVFDNLLKNAVSYSYENSVINVGARIINNRLVIKFRNRCDEIPKDKLDRLFDKFYRMDSSRASATGGSGLGLAIAKQLTELHGGTLTAKSNTDYTDFTVVLPWQPYEEITEEPISWQV